jgi:hypothetical protein
MSKAGFVLQKKRVKKDCRHCRTLLARAVLTPVQ